jgi:hypothetical protein
MSKHFLLLLAVALSAPAFADTISGTINGHSFTLSGQAHNFFLVADSRTLLHDTGDDSISIAGSYAFGPSSSSFIESSGGSAASSSSSSFTSSDGANYGVALLEETEQDTACPRQFQALIITQAATLSPPFGTCQGHAKIYQTGSSVIVVTPRPGGQTNEIDTITATGVATRFGAN